MRRARDVAAEINRMIDMRIWPAGQKLPADRELCKQFGAARLTLRRALDLVEQDERIVRRDRRGRYVRDDLSYDDDDPASGALFLNDLSKASPADLMELRIILEPTAASLATVRATSEDLDQILAICERVQGSIALADREQFDADFHLAIVNAARNPLLTALCQSVNEVRGGDEWIRKKAAILSPEKRAFYDLQHASIVASMHARDPEAATSATREHLISLRKDLWGPGLI